MPKGLLWGKFKVSKYSKFLENYKDILEDGFFKFCHCENYRFQLKIKWRNCWELYRYCYQQLCSIFGMVKCTAVYVLLFFIVEDD